MDESKLILSCKIPYGKKGIIRKIEGPDYHVLRLREMGFHEGLVVIKASDDAHRCIILNFQGRKFYLNEGAAHSILVELL
jgi:Fe2+ transport system protein FeoA